MKIWHDCLVTYVLWVIWDVELDGDTHFTFDPKSGQVQVRKSQILTIFFLTIPIMPCFVSEFQKCHLYCRTTLYPYLFFGLFIAKNKDIGLEIGLPFVGTLFYDIYFVFWIS